MVRLVQTAQVCKLIRLNAVPQVVVGLMQTAQERSRPTRVSGEHAARRLRDRSTQQSMATPAANHYHCGDPHDPSQAWIRNLSRRGRVGWRW